MKTRRQNLGSSEGQRWEVIRSGERVVIALKMKSHFCGIIFMAKR